MRALGAQVSQSCDYLVLLFIPYVSHLRCAVSWVWRAGVCVRCSKGVSVWVQYSWTVPIQSTKGCVARVLLVSLQRMREEVRQRIHAEDEACAGGCEVRRSCESVSWVCLRGAIALALAFHNAVDSAVVHPMLAQRLRLGARAHQLTSARSISARQRPSTRSRSLTTSVLAAMALNYASPIVCEPTSGMLRRARRR